MVSLKPHYLPNQDAIVLGVSASTHDFWGGHTHSVRSTQFREDGRKTQKSQLSIELDTPCSGGRNGWEVLLRVPSKQMAGAMRGEGREFNVSPALRCDPALAQPQG